MLQYHPGMQNKIGIRIEALSTLMDDVMITIGYCKRYCEYFLYSRNIVLVFVAFPPSYALGFCIPGTPCISYATVIVK